MPRALLPLLLLLPVSCASAHPEEAAPAPRVEPADADVGLAEGPVLHPWQTIGHSREGRALEAIRFGAGAPRIYVVGGIHGDEREGADAVSDLCAQFARERPEGEWRVVRDANPDGTAAKTRGNAVGVDLNRNWPAQSFTASRGRGDAPLSEPETLAVHADLVAFDPDLILVVHSSRRGPFVNYDGPAAKHAAAFAMAANEEDDRWKVVPDMGYATPGSIGSWLGVDQRRPILTIEFRRGEQSAHMSRAGLAGMLAAARAERDAAVGKRHGR